MKIVLDWPREGGSHTFTVSKLDCMFGTIEGDARIGRTIPRAIRMTLELPPETDAGEPFFAFANEQHAKPGDETKYVEAVLRVYSGKSIEQSLNTIVINDFWITDIDMTMSTENDKFLLNMTIAPGNVMISNVLFVHRLRVEQLTAGKKQE